MYSSRVWSTKFTKESLVQWDIKQYEVLITCAKKGNEHQVLLFGFSDCPIAYPEGR